MEQENEFLKQAISDLESECNDLQKQADLIELPNVEKKGVINEGIIAEKNKLTAEILELKMAENKIKEELVEATKRNQEVVLLGYCSGSEKCGKEI